LQIKTKIISCHTADLKPVKQEVNSTVILSPFVFSAQYSDTLYKTKECDTQHNYTRHNNKNGAHSIYDTQHNKKNGALNRMTLSITITNATLSIVTLSITRKTRYLADTQHNKITANTVMERKAGWLLKKTLFEKLYTRHIYKSH
jgi:hypothetical protein